MTIVSRVPPSISRRAARHWGGSPLVGELDHHRGVHASRNAEAAHGLQTVSEAAATADEAHQAINEHYARLTLARQRRTLAEEAVQPRTHCPDCEQTLESRSGDGPLCPLCRQPDPGLPARQAQRAQQVIQTKAAEQAAQSGLVRAQQTAQQAVDARRKAEQDAQRLVGRAAAYRAQEIEPRELALSRTCAAQAEAKARLEAVQARRQELAQLGELESKATSSARSAENADKA
ncbi:hypothetical protein ACFWBX_08800 [Streptomyces sp. NPDC059991]|uniref:hypothetical protein n=1 Tax=Streptomyces sp. NPDC059991 TaxID=3347028 RepID=UPI003677DEF4